MTAKLHSKTRTKVVLQRDIIYAIHEAVCFRNKRPSPADVAEQVSEVLDVVLAALQELHEQGLILWREDSAGKAVLEPHTENLWF